MLLAAPIWFLMDILYVWVEEHFYFHKMFPGYGIYRQQTPMLLPTRASIRRCWQTLPVSGHRGGRKEPEGQMDRDAWVVEAFTAWAETYDATLSGELEKYAGISHPQVLDRVLGLAQPQPGEAVLDIGTGTGWLAIRCALAQPGVEIEGVDITPEMLRQAERNAERAGVAGRLRLTHGSAVALAYADAHFDVVISALALHHTEVGRSLDEMLRVLKPGGRIAIADMGAPPAWRKPPISWLMALLGPLYGWLGGAKGKAEAEALPNTLSVEQWQALLAARDLRQAQVTAAMRPRQGIYPCVILVSGKKGGV